MGNYYLRSKCPSGEGHVVDIPNCERVSCKFNSKWCLVWWTSSVLRAI